MRAEWRRAVAADRGDSRRSFWRLAKLVVVSPVLVLLYAALLTINLVRPVRIGSLSAKGRLSVMISYIEPCLRDLTRHGRTPLLIVINPGASPNEQLSAMYSRRVWLIDDRMPALRTLAFVLYKVLSSAGSRLAVELRSGHLRRYEPAWREVPSLSFDADERARGTRLLERLGIAPDAPYVCFTLRDAAYYAQFTAPTARARDLNTEGDRATFVRNPELTNYLPALRDLAAADNFVVRMGKDVGVPLPGGLGPRVVDYAASERSDFGDIYLVARCRFLLTGAAGIFWIASAFNRPVVHADAYTIWGHSRRPGDLFIPRRLWRAAERRFLSFREMLESGFHYSYEENCRRDGIEIVANTSDEILAVVREMQSRLDGTWIDGPDDEELQRRFQAVYGSRPEDPSIAGRIGAQFLRDNRDLL